MPQIQLIPPALRAEILDRCPEVPAAPARDAATILGFGFSPTSLSGPGGPAPMVRRIIALEDELTALRAAGAVHFSPIADTEGTAYRVRAAAAEPFVDDVLLMSTPDGGWRIGYGPVGAHGLHEHDAELPAGFTLRCAAETAIALHAGLRRSADARRAERAEYGEAKAGG